MRSALFGTVITVALSMTGAEVAKAAGRYLEVDYPPSTQAGELQLGVTYTLWIPDGVAHLRGILVHQHGCGAGACKGGETAAYDLHWQALARKWDCALLGPSYRQDDTQNCRLWCDPRNGSAKTFLRAISELATKSGHLELEKVPWCLWGHSGGGFWASLMQAMYPDRIVAIWLRSGTAYARWESGEIPKPEIPDSIYAIPVMCNPGAKENGDKRFSGAWDGCLAMFNTYRSHGAPIGFAPDPRTSHQCGDCRYLAIPYFDACLAMRLPDKGSVDQRLKPVDMKTAWLAALMSEQAEPLGSYRGKADEAVWLPNETVAKVWAEYVKIGAVSDSTPPPAAFNVRAVRQPDQSVDVTWDAEADFESGIQAFIVQRDGKDLAQVPETPVGKFGRPLFQSMSYHDTPERPLPDMRYVDRSPPPGTGHEYRVIVVNGVGLRSSSTSPVSAP
jgi:pimeloyl-ACP methyl ester carboxylesterase